MKSGYIACIDCGKEVIRAVTKKRKGRCYECWQCYQQAGIEKKHPYYTVETEEDLLSAAYESAPWIFKALRIPLPAFLVRRGLRQYYQDYKAKLDPEERIWPFHFNQMSLAMGRGFVVVRDGKPDRVWVTEMS